MIEKLENMLEKKGVKVFKNSPVSEIITNNNEVKGIVLEDGRSIPYEIVISNVDLPTTESKLIKKNNNNSFDKKQMTPSVMTFYWGLNKETDFPHHMIFLPDNYEGCFDDLFIKKTFPNGMPFYTSSPSVSDKSLSPSGKSTLFVLVPLPVTEKDNEINIYSNEIEKIKTKIFDRFKHHNIDLTKDNIEFEKIYSPDEWKNLFGLYKTSAFGASHNLFNIGPFRNKNKSSYKGLYYVGASTTPGTGLPMVTLSGKLVSDRIENDLS